MIRRYTTTVVALFAAATIASGCSGPPEDDLPASAQPGGGTTTGTRPGVAGQPSAPVRKLDPKLFGEEVKKPGVVVVDVRTAAEYANGHLAKAVNMDMQAAGFAQRLTTLDKSATYAIYCRTGHRSGIAAEQMHAAGLTVVELVGGVVAWTSAGNPLVTG